MAQDKNMMRSDFSLAGTWDDDHGSSGHHRRARACPFSISTMLLLFFALVAPTASAFTTHLHHFAVGASVGRKWLLTSLSSYRNKEEAPSSNKKRHEKRNTGNQQQQQQGGPQSVRELTEDDFVSYDPVEHRLLPLLQKICECETPKVAEPGLRLFHTLRKHKPVRARWVNEAIKCWREHPDVSEQVQNPEDLLQAMLELSNDFPTLEPDRYSYGLVMGAWTHHARESKDIRSMERAEQYLGDMWTRWEEAGASKAKPRREPPDLFSYRAVFRGWMKFAPTNRSTEAQSYQKALALLVELRELHQEGFTEYKLDDRFQEDLRFIGFHVNKCAIESLPTVEGITKELEASYGDSRLRPVQLRLFADIKREIISRHMQDKLVDTETAMSKISPLLREWWAKCNHAEDSFARLNTIYVSKIIAITARSTIRDAYARSRAFLQEVWKLYHETGDDSIKPDGITYSALANVLSKKTMGDAGERAGDLLKEMWDLYNSDTTENAPLKPDVVTYGNIMQVWAKSDDKNAGDEAEKLLRDMWDRHDEGDKDLKPSKIHYSQVISAMSNLGSKQGVDRAESLLQEMWDRYHETGDEAMKPDRITYTSLITVLANSKMSNAGDRAEGLLEELWGLYYRDMTKNEDLKPNAFAYSSVMQVWVNSKNRYSAERVEELLQVLWDRYKSEGDKDLRPTKVHQNQVVVARDRSRKGKNRKMK